MMYILWRRSSCLCTMPCWRCPEQACPISAESIHTPQALMQSAQYLNSHREWQQISAANTALAAKKIWEDKDIAQAAVASESAGRLYGLKTLACPINFDKNNTTPLYRPFQIPGLPEGCGQGEHLL